MAHLINGKEISAAIRAELKDEVAALKARGVTPGLAVIIVGDDPASRVYVNNKKKACAELGMLSEEYALPASVSMADLLSVIEVLNSRDDIHGILCQLPLPKHLDEREVINAIDPKKDVDAFHPINVGGIMTSDYRFLPCTPAGVMLLLERSCDDLPLENARFKGNLPQGRPHRRGRRQGRLRHRRYGQAGRRSHRRGYEPPRKRQALRRRRL